MKVEKTKETALYRLAKHIEEVDPDSVITHHAYYGAFELSSDPNPPMIYSLPDVPQPRVRWYRRLWWWVRYR